MPQDLCAIANCNKKAKEDYDGCCSYTHWLEQSKQTDEEVNPKCKVLGCNKKAKEEYDGCCSYTHWLEQSKQTDEEVNPKCKVPGCNKRAKEDYDGCCSYTHWLEHNGQEDDDLHPRCLLPGCKKMRKTCYEGCCSATHWHSVEEKREALAIKHEPLTCMSCNLTHGDCVSYGDNVLYTSGEWMLWHLSCWHSGDLSHVDARL